jgi:uncharacterized membrane protein
MLGACLSDNAGIGDQHADIRRDGLRHIFRACRKNREIHVLRRAERQPALYRSCRGVD